MRKPIMDMATFGGMLCKREGWFWVPVHPEELEAMEQADWSRFERRERIGWTLAFILATAVFVAAILKEVF